MKLAIVSHLKLFENFQLSDSSTSPKFPYDFIVAFKYFHIRIIYKIYM